MFSQAEWVETSHAQVCAKMVTILKFSSLRLEPGIQAFSLAQLQAFVGSWYRTARSDAVIE